MLDVPTRTRVSPAVTLLAGAMIATFATWTGLASARERAVSDARRLEQRLHAPCCRHQLLDGHDSELARGLRQEIRARLRGGEASAAVEADLVQRYGESIVSIPPDRDPRGGLSILVMTLMGLASLGLSWLGVRWVRRSNALPVAAAAAGSGPSDALDARLDDELRRLEP